MEALNHCLTKDFEKSSIHEVDFWTREFIRDSDEDLNWLFLAIEKIGFDHSIMRRWFAIDAQNTEKLTKLSHSLIEFVASAFGDIKLSKVGKLIVQQRVLQKEDLRINKRYNI
jgi:hypothetical protein